VQASAGLIAVLAEVEGIKGLKAVNDLDVLIFFCGIHLVSLFK
jgi:hypothetical protein